MITGIRHCGMFTSKFDETVEFYKNLGMEIVYRGLENWNPDFGFLKIAKLKATDGNVFEIMESGIILPEELNYRGTHVALSVKDIETIYQELRENNIEFIIPPRYSPDKSVKVAFCRDPNGLKLELVEELAEQSSIEEIMDSSPEFASYVNKSLLTDEDLRRRFTETGDNPWHLKEYARLPDIKMFMTLLKDYAPFDYILELGCGTGQNLNLLKNEVAAPDCIVEGYDRSNDALNLLKKEFPDIDTHILDLRLTDSPTIKKIRRRVYKKQLIVMRGVLWYIVLDINKIMHNIDAITKKGSYFFLSNPFPFLSEGNSPSPKQIASLFKKINFEVMKSVWYDTGRQEMSDGGSCMLLRKTK